MGRGGELIQAEWVSQLQQCVMELTPAGNSGNGWKIGLRTISPRSEGGEPSLGALIHWNRWPLLSPGCTALLSPSTTQIGSWEPTARLRDQLLHTSSLHTAKTHFRDTSVTLSFLELSNDTLSSSVSPVNYFSSPTMAPCAFLWWVLFWHFQFYYVILSSDFLHCILKIILYKILTIERLLWILIKSGFCQISHFSKSWGYTCKYMVIDFKCCKLWLQIQPYALLGH